MKRLLLLPLSLFICSQSTSQIEPPLPIKDVKTILKYVIGKDDRVAVLSHEFPWSAVGKLFRKDSSGDTYTCTGTLVSKYLVVTNAHCVSDPKRKVNGPIRFHPNFRRGKSLHESQITGVWLGEGTETENDWAVVKLHSPLGENYGTFEIKTPTAEELSGEGWQNKLSLPGYSFDFESGNTAGVHLGCGFLSDQGKLGFRHSCDMNNGASGGPIFGLWPSGPALIGLNVAHTKDEVYGFHKNYGVYASKFAEKVKSIIASKLDEPTTTTVHLCNHAYQGTLMMALAYWEDKGWSSRGWFAAKFGECREIDLPAKYDGDVFVYANNFLGRDWRTEGKYSFCIGGGGKNNFHHRSADKICATGWKPRFSLPWTISHSELNSLSFTSR